MDLAADLIRTPDDVTVFGADGPLAHDGPAHGGPAGVDVTTDVVDGALRITLTATAPVTRLRLRWRTDLTAVTGYLEDAWERSYGDLAWRPEQPERPMPWSFVADSPDGAAGAGVRINPGALCFFTADAAGVTLWADVRCGGSAVHLAGRTLHVADVVTVAGADGERPFAVQRRLATAMATGAPVSARLPDHPVYGTNDWHYALGTSDAPAIMDLAAFTAAAAGDADNRPYVVIDDGWSAGGLGSGPWIGNGRYGDMGRLARRMDGTGVRPALWYRPLTPLPEHRDGYRLSRHGGVLDPTHDAVRDSVAEQVHRFRSWGYQLLKHDFTVWDLLGRWGFQMGAGVTDDGWTFADTSRTTAEVVTDLYRSIREAAGPDMIVMGCNAFGHLVAGHAELQRIGDDASGRSWNRTRRMAVNTLAFRGPQHDALYAVDADVAPLTAAMAWTPSVQWLHLLCASGTPAFVSVDPPSRTRALPAVREGFALAQHPRHLAEPLDRNISVTPRRWRFGEREHTYDWSEPDGAWPFGD